MKTLNLDTLAGVNFFQRIVTAYANNCLTLESEAQNLCRQYLLEIAIWYELGYSPGKIAEKIQAKEHEIKKSQEK